MAKFSYRKGFKGFESDDEAFLKPSAGSDPWTHKASGEGYAGRRWDDDSGVTRGECGYSSDDGAGQNNWDTEANTAAFLEASTSRTDQELPHQRLSRLIDGQVDQPAGEILGGGGPVSDNKVGGVGAGKPRYKAKTGPQSNDGL